MARRGAIHIEIKSKGKNPLLWLKQVNDRIHFEFQQRLVELGEETARRMQTIIVLAKKRNKGILGKLEKSINSEILNSAGGISIGIGRIVNLPPYWEVINNGGYVPPTTNKLVPLGSFGGEAPDASKSGGTWDVGKGNYTFLDNKSPKKPIEPMRYVEISDQELRLHIQKEINRLMKESRALSR